MENASIKYTSIFNTKMTDSDDKLSRYKLVGVLVGFFCSCQTPYIHTLHTGFFQYLTKLSDTGPGRDHIIKNYNMIIMTLKANFKCTPYILYPL